jgi:hypothetical protein
MKTMRMSAGVCALLAVLAPAAMAQQSQNDDSQVSNRDAAYDEGYAAGYAAAMRELRRRGSSRSAAYARRGYVSEYTPYSPYAWQNRPRTSMPAVASAGRPRTDVRGVNELDDYVDYPSPADYRRRPGEALPPRGNIYDAGDFRAEQGGIYGNRGVLLWTDRYDAGDYANKFWNTHRNNVYAGQRVWNTYNGDQ